MTLTTSYEITWEKLPDDYVLDDEPVDNLNQPPLAAALTESLELSGRYPETALITTNYGICATLNQRIVVKAPDWSYVASIRVPRADVERSYTPQLQGDIPTIIIEFLSYTEGDAYSIKPTFPPGKWFFYERILKVANYAIFDPASGALEFYRLDAEGRYQIQTAEGDRHWVPGLDLFLGVWQGTRQNRNGAWLRWWDAQGELLPWGTERAEQERQRAEQERQRAERLIAQLRAAGLEPEV